MKFLAINGSLAEESVNRKLLHAIKKQFEDKHAIEIAELHDLPIFKEHDEESEPEAVLALAEKIEEADGVIIASPEYNHSISSALKSMLEWLSYNIHPFEDKPVLVVGASTLLTGTARSQTNVKKILEAPGVNAIAMPGSEFLFGNAAERFDDAGNIKDDGTRDFLASVIERFAKFTQATESLSIPEILEFNPGTYQAEAEGYNGVIPMKVTFSDNRIEDIEIDTSGETKGISDAAFERIPQTIIENQTLNVDAVAGASGTTQGIVDGVSDAVARAGGNVSALKKRPKKAKEANKQETIEKETDVVVIGGGGAGLSAAAAALENDAEVVLLEKFPTIGGNTNRTGGPMNAADPAWASQIDAIAGEDHTLENIAQTPEEDIHEEYLEDFRELKGQIEDYLAGDREKFFDSTLLHRIQTYLGGKRTDLAGNKVYGNYDLVKTMTDNVLDTVHWLEDKGVDFDMDAPQMPVGALWRRGHKPQDNEGYAYIAALESFINDEGGEILTDTKVTKILSEDGKVTGVEATTGEGNKLVIHAQSVVMGSGGFGANTPMLQKYNTYWENIPDDIATSNSPAITGDGIELAEGVNVQLVDMGLIQMLPTCDPTTGALFVGLQVPPENFIMVNYEGKRFVNEYGGRDEIAKAAFANSNNNDGLFYLIADEKIKETAMNTNQEKIDKEIEEGILYRADTLEELAEQIDVDPDVLVETVDTYNSYVDAGEDPDFGKSVFNLKCTEAPFYATPRKPAIHHTMGGVKINTDAEVINTENQVIEGLYAAGEQVGGIHAGNRLGGNALADIFTFGRIAGANAAK